ARTAPATPARRAPTPGGPRGRSTPGRAASPPARRSTPSARRATRRPVRDMPHGARRVLANRPGARRRARRARPPWPKLARAVLAGRARALRTLVERDAAMRVFGHHPLELQPGTTEHLVDGLARRDPFVPLEHDGVRALQQLGDRLQHLHL